MTSSSCGLPPSRKLRRRISHRPPPPGNMCATMRPDSCASMPARPSSAALRPCRFSLVARSKFSPALLTMRSLQRRVEREHRDVDVGDDLLQQRAGLERLEPLVVERAAQRVDLDHDLAERVLGIDVAAAHRVVALAQRFEHVRERLQRPHDVAAQGDEADQDAQAEKAENRPAQRRRRARQIQQHRGRHDERRHRQERDEQHPVLKTQALAPRHRPNFSMRRYSAERLMPSSSAAATTLPSWRASAARIASSSTSSSVMARRSAGDAAAGMSRRSAGSIAEPRAISTARSMT